MPTRPEVRRAGRRWVEGSPDSSTSVLLPIRRGLRAAHVRDLVVCPGEAAAAVTEPLQGATGEITERAEA
jgi:hypothetical protein